ncbi:MFS transporter [Neorhizobium sp. T6_25]|uniref:MFS transporter n=1 Tax=Neorhizobium sp. T6_25 TaxID=2093833 RepID=UPI00352B6AC9
MHSIKSPRPSVVILLLTITSTLVVGQMYTVLALFEPMSQAFGTPIASVAWMSTAFGIPYAVGGLLAGPLSDRLGQRTIIVAALAATSLTSLLVAFAVDLANAVELRALQGLAAAFLAPVQLAYVNRHLPQRVRALALTAIISASVASAIVMQVGAQLLAAAFGWPAAFHASAALILVMAIMSYRLLEPPVRAETSFKAILTVFPSILRQPRYLGLYLATSTLLGGFIAIFAALTLAGGNQLAANREDLLIFRASALPIMVLIPFASTMIGRFSVLVRMTGGLLLAACAALLMSLAVDAFWPMVLLLSVFIVGILVASPALIQRLCEMAGRNAGAATSLYTFSIFLGASAAPPLVGALTGLSFSQILQCIAVVVFSGAILVALAGRNSHAAA